MRSSLPYLLILILALCLPLATSSNKNRQRFQASFLTDDNGHRTGNNQDSQTATADGGALLQDSYIFDKLRSFVSEKIPERVVHARGVGAFGYFKSSVDFSSFTAADFLSRPGRFTKVFVRFSTVLGRSGSPEAIRNPRGFAVKFYSKKDGNFDLVGNNIPVFFIRDQMKLPDLVHAEIEDPVTNLPDSNRAFDFFSAIGGEATNMLTYLFSPMGIPKNYRYMDGNGVHAYKFVNSAGEYVYFKYRWMSKQGIVNISSSEAAEIRSKDSSHATRDLLTSIKNGKFPRWDLLVQIVKPEQLSSFDFNPLDATKIWPEDKFPFQNVGTLVLNKVPKNFFLSTEQVAFNPGNYLPGRLEPSEDRLLQGRLVSYQIAQAHRHGSHLFNNLPINAPIASVKTYNQGGYMRRQNTWYGSLNYEPSNLKRTFKEDPSYLYSKLPTCGTTQQSPISKPVNFRQAGILYKSFSKSDQNSLIASLGGALGSLRSDFVKNIMCSHFYKADNTLGEKLSEAASCDLMKVRKLAEKLMD